MPSRYRDPIHVEALERYELGWEADQENRRHAIEDLEFRAGEQWPERIRSERDSTGRPVLTINRMGQFIRQITGDMKQTKPGLKARAVDMDADEDTAEIISGLIRYIENLSDSREAYTKGSDNQVTCGIGHWRVNTKYAGEDVFEQDIVIEPIPYALAVIWDPSSKMTTREDAKWCFELFDMVRDDFEAEYPKYASEGFTDADQTDTNLRDWFSRENVRVAAYWRKIPATRKLAQLQTGQVIDVTDFPLNQISSLQPIRVVDRETHRVQRFLITAVEIIEGPVDWPGKYIPIIPVIGEEIDLGRGIYRHGLVRFMKDPQRLYNYWRSNGAETISLQPKAPFIIPATMVEGYEKYWNTANQKNWPYLPFKPDPLYANFKPSRERPPDPAVAALQEAQIANEDMKGVSGIYDASLGAKSNETSGRAIIARQREGDVGSFHYMDNWARAIAYTGRIIVDLIPYYYDSERVIRILGEDNTEEQVVVNGVDRTMDGLVSIYDLTTGKYDVVIEVGPSYTTKKMEASENMREFLKSVPQLASVIGDLYVKAQDWPMADKIAERLERMVPPELRGEQAQLPPPDPAQQAAEAAQMAQVEAGAQDAQAKAAKSQASAQAEATKVQIAQENLRTAQLKTRQAAQDIGLTGRERMQDIALTRIERLSKVANERKKANAARVAR